MFYSSIQQWGPGAKPSRGPGDGVSRSWSI